MVKMYSIIIIILYLLETKFFVKIVVYNLKVGCIIKYNLDVLSDLNF